MSGTLAERVDRLEALHAIGQLAIRYAVAVDGRDVESWLALFPQDVCCGRHGTGREVLRSLIVPQLRSFYRSIHSLGGHRVELDGPDRGRGIVYCRAEHEVGERWMVMTVAYFDDYVRQDGDWYFARRRERHWYSADQAERPAPPFHRWPEDAPAERLPAEFPTWLAFWNETEEDVVAHLTRAPVRSQP